MDKRKRASTAKSSDIHTHSHHLHDIDSSSSLRLPSARNPSRQRKMTLQQGKLSASPSLSPKGSRTRSIDITKAKMRSTSLPAPLVLPSSPIEKTRRGNAQSRKKKEVISDEEKEESEEEEEEEEEDDDDEESEEEEASEVETPSEEEEEEEEEETSNDESEASSESEMKTRRRPGSRTRLNNARRMKSEARTLAVSKQNKKRKRENDGKKDETVTATTPINGRARKRQETIKSPSSPIKSSKRLELKRQKMLAMKHKKSMKRYQDETESDDNEEDESEEFSDSTPEESTKDIKRGFGNDSTSKQANPVHKWSEGAECLCLWKHDNEYHPAKIIQRKKMIKSAESSSTGTEEEVYIYYIHYIDFDRRLDEWVEDDKLKPKKKNESKNSRNVQHISPEEANGKMKTPKKRSNEFSKFIESEKKVPNHILSELKMDLITDEPDENDKDHVRNIDSIQIGNYDIDTWYYSPFPDEYDNLEKLYFCEYCLRYMKRRYTFVRHKVVCKKNSPPGRRIYKDKDVAVFEVDGKKEKEYCQSLCLLSKLFLDHKTLYFDVEPFLFYVLTEVDKQGYHIVGYFSKEKNSHEGFNLSCILTLPPHQRKGYGSFLISLSYELNKKEGKIGSPEKPLTDLGRIGYLSYWTYTVLTLIESTKKSSKSLSIAEISKRTSITEDDIIETFRNLNAIKQVKGKHVISLSDSLVDQYLKHANKKIRLCDPKYLTWERPSKTLATSSSSSSKESGRMRPRSQSR